MTTIKQIVARATEAAQQQSSIRIGDGHINRSVNCPREHERAEKRRKIT